MTSEQKHARIAWTCWLKEAASHESDALMVVRTGQLVTDLGAVANTGDTWQLIKVGDVTGWVPRRNLESV